MIDAHYITDTVIENNTKIVLLVVDGLGGMPSTKTKLSELQTAKTPNLDLLSHSSSCGLNIPVAQGVTPGSGTGPVLSKHLTQPTNHDTDCSGGA